MAPQIHHLHRSEVHGRSVNNKPDGTITLWYGYVHGVKGRAAMHFHEDGNDIPIARSGEKKSNLAKDEKIKGFWNNLVNDWLTRAAKPKDKDKDKDKNSPED